MAIVDASRAPRAPSGGRADDERSLLLGLEALLERENALLVARDPDALAAVAHERERITERLSEAVRERRTGRAGDPDDDADLLALYRRVRQRHDVQAKIVRQHLEQNACALGVIAQATGRSNLYQANGRVPLHFVSV